MSLPAQVDVNPTKTVVCFNLFGAPMAVLLEEVREVLEVPVCTRLPRVQRWVKGVANVHGNLIPIVDFANFLGGRLQAAPKYQRVMIVEFGGISAGLIVDQVLGMKHFRVDTFSENREMVVPEITPYVPGTFFHDDEHWALFRPEALFRDEGFLNVAA
jgi:twitching motility protein PilI